MTAASQEPKWLQAKAHHTFLPDSDFQFDHDDFQASEVRFPDNCIPKNDPDTISNSSSAVYSLSDISVTSSSSSEKEAAETEIAGAELSPSQTKVSSNFLFLPPCSNACPADNTTEWSSQPSFSPPYFLDCESDRPICKDDDNDIDRDECSARDAASGLSVSSQVLDVASMREKLEAQREYLIGTLQRQPSLPPALTAGPKYPPVRKAASFKMKEKLHKFGRATQRFWSTKILRRRPTAQRCEIQLQGLHDSIQHLILIVSCRQKGSSTETLHFYMPSAFETDRVVLPKFLLPNSSGERVTVCVYGVAAQNNPKLPSFSKVTVSGVCTIYSGSALVTGKVELQPHRPCHSLTGHTKNTQSCGSSIKVNNTSDDSYSFSTLPKPVARHFTELCILQTASPFQEYFAMSSSSCDHPASFTAQLVPGKYQAVCSYRLTNGPAAGTFPIDSATPAAFFRAHTDKTGVADNLKAAVAMEKQGSNNTPLLLPSLPLLKPHGFNLEALMTTLRTGHNQPVNSLQSASSAMDTADKALHICAWDIGVPQKVGNGNIASQRFMEATPQSVTTNPRLSTGDLELVLLPPLSVFNMSMCLYFADYWSYYDKHYVTLVLCRKRSPCHQVCKKNFHKLDPYENPFLFRKRHLDPEPEVTVHASANVSVEVVYSNSEDIQRLVSSCSENVYFSKVQVG